MEFIGASKEYSFQALVQNSSLFGKLFTLGWIYQASRLDVVHTTLK